MNKTLVLSFLCLISTLSAAENMTINASLGINGTFSLPASDNSSNIMCLNITQDGTVKAYDCDNPSVGGRTATATTGSANSGMSWTGILFLVIFIAAAFLIYDILFKKRQLKQKA